MMPDRTTRLLIPGAVTLSTTGESVYVFGEQLRRPHAAGIALIATGIACVLAGA